MKRLLPVILATTLAACAAMGPLFATPGYTVEKNVRYTPADWPEALLADVYVPSGRGPFPAVLMVHGGGWNARDRSDMDGISKKLAGRGYVVANIQYRLAPAHLYPAQLDDVRAAIAWLHSNAARLQLDGQRIGGWGYSAGAHLVALAATKDSDHPQRLRAVVAGGMPSDFSRYPKSPIITTFIGAPYPEAQGRWKDASPVFQVSPRTPPMFLYHGSFDRLVGVDQSVAMKEALDQAQVPAELRVVRGLGHITTFLFGRGAEKAGIEFLDRYLGA